jgi:hypothetical protein
VEQQQQEQEQEQEPGPGPSSAAGRLPARHATGAEDNRQRQHGGSAAPTQKTVYCRLHFFSNHWFHIKKTSLQYSGPGAFDGK